MYVCVCILTADKLNKRNRDKVVNCEWRNGGKKAVMSKKGNTQDTRESRV